jgi:hypothetical protein
MKTQTKHTILLSPDEVKDAVREYINLHSCGKINIVDSISVFVVLDDDARHADFEIEALFFE